MKRGHVTGHKRERRPRQVTIERQAQQATVIEQMAAEMAKKLMEAWQVR